MAENKKTAENVNIAMEQDGRSTKPRCRSHVILAATVFGVLAIAGIVFAAVYVGHVMTHSSYQEAHIFYREDEGTMVEEKVQIAEEEVDFEADGRFTVVYDFKNKLVIIRPLGNRVVNKCYMTNLTSDMGTMEEIRQRINSAEKSGVFASDMDQAAYFTAIDKMAEIPSTSAKARKMCSSLPVQWIERTVKGRQTGLMKRDTPCIIRVTVIIRVIIIKDDVCYIDVGITVEIITSTTTRIPQIL